MKNSVDNAINDANDHWAVHCGSCLPSYRAIKGVHDNGNNDASDDVVIDHFVKECVLIPNCTTSNWFNSCSKCDNGAVYGYDPVKGVQYDLCLKFANDAQATTNPNCYAADFDGAVAKNCIFCRKGFVLNVDGYCEEFNPPRCAFGQFRHRFNYEVKDLGTGLSLSSEGVGCFRCDSGFSGMYTHQKNAYVCTQSPYHTNNKVSTTASKFLHKCKHYKIVQNERR